MQTILSGITILDLSRMLAGPYGTLLLSDLGAEIIKIEQPGQGDPTRNFLERSVLAGESGYFMSCNRGKKSVTLDLRAPEGRELFYGLVKTADVVWENFRPSVVGRLKIDYETLKEFNPRIICCSISGFGHTVPEPDRPAFDLILQALGGTMGITGEPGRRPVKIGIPIGDLAGGMFGALAVVSALFHRAHTGQGQKIDISLLDCQLSLLSYLGQYYLIDGDPPRPLGSGHETVVPYQAFETQDGALVISTFIPKFWEGLCRALGREDLLRDPRFETNLQRRRHKGELIPVLEEVFRERTTAEWLARLREHDIPSAPIHDIAEALEQPDARHRNMVVEIEHPKAGRYRAIGNPIKMSSLPDDRFPPPPTLGQHTYEVLQERLGLERAQLEEYERRGII